MRLHEKAPFKWKSNEHIQLPIGRVTKGDHLTTGFFSFIRAVACRWTVPTRLEYILEVYTFEKR